MRASLLNVIAVYSNPIRWESRLRIHQEFERHMLDSGVRLTVVECQFGDRPWDLPDNPHINRVRVRCRGMVWNKENLQNIALTRLPEDAKYIATVDADVMFRKPGWASEAVHALQHYHVVQPWSNCYDLGPNDDHLECHHSFLKEWFHGNPMTQGIDAKNSPYRFGHCGYAWAWTRQAIDWLGGFLEIGALGAGDHHMALAMIGRARDSLPGGISNGYKRHVFEWEKRALHHLNYQLGYVPGTIEHSWHGPKKGRNYVGRWDVILKHNYDPDYDVKRNANGVIELTGNKPRFHHDIDLYLRQRNEDATTI